MVKGRAIKEKITFFGTFISNAPKFQRPLSSRGGGLGLNDPAIKRRTFFCGFPYLASSSAVCQISARQSNSSRIYKILCEKRSHQLIVIVKDIDLYMVSQSADANAF